MEYYFSEKILIRTGNMTVILLISNQAIACVQQGEPFGTRNDLWRESSRYLTFKSNLKKIQRNPCFKKGNRGKREKERKSLGPRARATVFTAKLLSLRARDYAGIKFPVNFAGVSVQFRYASSRQRVPRHN